MKYVVLMLSMIILTSCSGKNDERQYVNEDVPLDELLRDKNLKKSELSIEVSKSQYTLYIKHGSEIIKSYPVVLGPDPVNDKLMEGDGCTPEGRFRIRDKYPHRKWTYFIWLDYPNDDSRAKHKKAKREGKIPQDAEIGGEVGIHGVPEGCDSRISEGKNWTAGCVSLTNSDISELYKFIDTDMTILITK